MFCKKLYCEGIRQSFLFGIFLIVTASILNCCYPIHGLIVDSNMASSSLTHNIENIQQNTEYTPEFKDILITQLKNISYSTNLTIEEANQIMLILMFVIPVIMIFVQFRFLDDRKACDFYHSIPVKRLTLVVSYSLSALTWIFLCMVIPMLLNGLIFSFDHTNVLDYSLLLPNIIEKVILSFLIYSALLIGISLSGQIITASVVAGLILFLPRFFVTTIAFIVHKNLSYYYYWSHTTSSMFGNHLNLLINKFTSTYDEALFGVVNLNTFFETTENFEKYSYNLNSYIYTLALSLILFAIGCYAFIKRPSEMAGKNTANSLTQHIIRIGLVTPIVIVYVFFINLDTYINSYFSPMIIIILVVYYTYELITTRDLKKLISATKALPFVFLVGFVHNTLIIVGESYYTSYPSISANDVNSVNINLNVEDGDSWSYITSFYDSHTVELISNHSFDDQQTIELVYDAMIKHIDYINIDTYTADLMSSLVSNVTFNTSSRNLSKFMCFDSSSSEEILDIILNDEYINTTLLATLPDKTDVVSARATSLGYKNYSYNETQTIIDTLYQEYNALTLEQQLEIVYSHNSSKAKQKYDNYRLMEELYRNICHQGGYKEDVFSDYIDGVTMILETSSYGSNDFPIVLALYTDDMKSKYIYINDLLPQTKKLLIDMFINSNKDSYDIFNYSVSGKGEDVIFTNLNLTSLDDYFNLSTELKREYDLHTNNVQFVPNQELFDLFDTASQNLSSNIDYDNLYVVTFTVDVNSTDFKDKRIILPLTQDEFETYVMHINEHSIMLNNRHEQIN